MQIHLKSAYVLSFCLYALAEENATSSVKLLKYFSAGAYNSSNQGRLQRLTMSKEKNIIFPDLVLFLRKFLKLSMI